MKNNVKNEFKLIDSTFTPEEAKEVLLNLVDSKINYHKLDDFRHFVRSDRNAKHSEKRIMDLTDTKEAIKVIIDEATKSGSRLVIKSDIIIKFLE